MLKKLILGGCCVWVGSAMAGADPTLPAGADSQGPGGMAGKLIDHYHMQRVPQEGPWFSLTYVSEDSLDGASLPARYSARPHTAGSAIVLLETAADFSAIHRLLTDEVWHFYGGAPIDMLLLYPDGHGRKITLGADVLAGELPQFTVPHGVWQGSAPRSGSKYTYSFAGDQLSPGFAYTDFEMGYRDALKREYPTFAPAIEGLTRIEYATDPGARVRASNLDSQLQPEPLKGTAFFAHDVPVQRPAPGVELQELVGRVARAQTSTLSIARFTLAPGRGSGTSFNHLSQEVLVITNGSGRVHLATRVLAVRPGSTVFIPAKEAHSIEANAASTLTFLAISVPAFSPDDHVAVKP